MPSRFRPATVAEAAVVASLFLLIAALCHTHLTDIDLWWHLAAGDLVRRTGEVPRLEPFSYTAAGRPWIDVQWLFQVVLSWLRERGGLAAVAALRMALVPGLFALLYLRCRRSAPAAATAPALLLAVLASQERFLVRPEIVSWVLMALVLAGLDRALETDDRAARRRLLWFLLPLVSILWANVQGLFMIGPVLTALALLAAAAGHFRRPVQGRDPRKPIDFGIALLLSAVAGLVNPYGLAILRVPFQQLFGHLGGTSLLSRSIAEFQPTLSGSFDTPTVASLGLLALCTLLALAVNARRARIFDILVIGATLYLALRARRNVPLFAIAAAPVLLRNAAQAWSARRDGPAGTMPGPAGTTTPGPEGPAGPSVATGAPARIGRGLSLAVLAATIVACAILTRDVVTNRFFERFPTERFWGGGTMPHYFPEEAARFVEQAALPGEVFNAFSAGGYLIDAWGGRRKVFIDSRNDPYLDGILQTYLAMSQAPAVFEEVSRRYGITTVLWPHARAIAGQALLAYLAQGHGWLLAHIDPAAAVYVKEERLPPGLGGRLPFRVAGGRDEVYARLLGEIERRRFPGPPLRETALAEFFAVSGDAAGAAFFYRRALQIRGDSAPLHHDLAMALTLGGRSREAREEHERAVALDPGFLHSLGEIGVLLMDEGRSAAAEPYLRDAYEQGGRTPRVVEALARLFDRRGEAERAVAAYQEAINLAPADPFLLRAVARFYLQRGEPEAALTFYEHAARADPGNPVVARERGALLEQRGALPAALEVVRGPAQQAGERLQGGGAGWVDAGDAPWPSLPATRPRREEDRNLLLLAARLEARAGDRGRAAGLIELLDRRGLLRGEELTADPVLRSLPKPRRTPGRRSAGSDRPVS